ncbi:hypothetical protein GCK72_004537 [Caenorhabditis remanei]|uniref:Uncharacterized protein n=1 Tax=Caenorhabditis remanei TaxID=31234 RepID=A0A6A5HA11_CAERE|nr:hypothetical protein GCK72_004537 [Caenorhabditis remanei]KAF1764588.1 hypothetical protein GCK72_004537 [Caenorhabditis remanei]
MNPNFIFFFGAVTSLMMVATATMTSALPCHQCVGGDFLLRKSLMQNPIALQTMGWVHKWSDTDCLTGNFHIIHNCQTTCVTIWIRKVQGHSNGVMFDCADDLIYHTPDIPGKGNLYSKEAIIFKDDVEYQNVRQGYNITYQFSTETIPVDQKLMATYFPVSKKNMTYPAADQKMSTATLIFYWILLGTCFMGLLVVVWIKCCANKPRQHAQNELMSSLAANIDQHRSENQISRQYTEISV